MNKLFLSLLIALPFLTMGQKSLMQWDFENIKHRNTVENISNLTDTIEGNYELAEGVLGRGLRLDGFTTRIVREAANVLKPGSEFTLEAWVALGEYPWNWCPVVTTENEEVKGYRLMIGPMGQLSLQVAIGEQWISCTSENEILPLRKWMHIAGVFQKCHDLHCYPAYIDRPGIFSADQKYLSLSQ